MLRGGLVQGPAPGRHWRARHEPTCRAGALVASRRAPRPPPGQLEFRLAC